MVRVQCFLHQDEVPVRVLPAIQLHDPVAGLKSSFRRRRTRLNRGDHRIGGVHFLRERVHVQPGDNRDCQHDVHQRTGDNHNGSLPSRLCLKRSRIGRLLVSSLIAQHTHVSAKWNSGNAEIGIAPANAKQPGPETDAECLYFDANRQGRPKVP
jgi:hypothetical protein